MIPRVLIIAGSDSGGGAGIQADIKAVTMLGGHAMTAITAITAQNTQGVNEAVNVSADMVIAQIDAVASDIGIDAIKIGMIGSAEIALALARRLKDREGVPVVFDPVMVATSGAVLADAGVIASFEPLMKDAILITPNIPELEALTDRRIVDEAGARQAALDLADRTGAAVLAKGGHLQGDEVVDLLAEPDGNVTRWVDPRITGKGSHGTGCTLASAIACGIGAHLPLTKAIERARAYTRAALEAAPGLGRGEGPLGHGLGKAHFG